MKISNTWALILFALLVIGGFFAWKSYTPSQTPVPIVSETWSTFASTTLGFSIQYPQSYVLNTAYKYDQLGPKEPTISGVKFTIPASMATGTNLSSFDTGVSVELMRGLPSCTAYPFLIQPSSKVITVVDGNATYFVASSSGAGAGNFYEETVYALEGSDPCVAIRYFIHSTNIGNYEPGAVQEFDRARLLDQFDKIRRSLQITSN